MQDKVKQTLNSILEIFKSGDIPKAVSFAVFPPFGIPSSKWSFLNNIILWLNGTNDARGFRQWEQVGRYVKKGAKAIYIFAPKVKLEKIDGLDTKTLIGFLTIPVFKANDTGGEPLNYQRAVPNFPLIEKAKEWGLAVSAVEKNQYFWGCYNGQQIKVATPDESVFFHELSHHAHKLILGELKEGQDWRQEIVAQLSAEALCRLVGRKIDTTGNSYRYIEQYAQDAKLSPVNACLQVLNETEQVLKLILQDSKNENLKEVAVC